MSTAADSNETKTGGEKSESSLRRSLRVAGLPAKVVPTESGTPRARRSSAGARTPSAEGQAASTGEAVSSAELEMLPTTETAVPPPSLPERKKSEDEQDGGAGAQPSARVGESPSLGEPAVSRALTPSRTSEAATATAQPQGANPEPTAANIRSGQAEGGALSMLGSREMQLRAQGAAGTGTIPVQFSFTPGTGHFRASSGGGAWSSSLWPDQHPNQRLRGVEADSRALAQLSEMSEVEMLAYGRIQLEMWMSVPTGVVHPVDVAYSPCHGGYDLWGFIRAAGATARHLMSVTRPLAARWLNVFHAERRRIPVVSDLKAVRVALRLMPPIACVALLQTMLHEAGYEFLNQVPVWYLLSEVDGVPDSQIQFEIERIARFLEAELSAWKAAVGSTPYYVRPASDPQLMSAQAAETQVGFPLDKDGDAVMDEDTQLFLGPEVVMRLQLTGLRPRSSTSTAEGEPSRKRALLARSSASGSIPSYHESGEAPAETALGFRSDQAPSMVGASSGSDMSLVVTDEEGNLSGLSSSGSSLMSMTDNMVGTGTHMPMSTATGMRGSATTIPRSSFPGMMISVTPRLTHAGAAPARAEQRLYRPEYPAQIPLPGSPEPKRPAPKQTETRQVQSTGFWFAQPSVIGSARMTTLDDLPSVERDYRRALRQSEATTWARLDVEQNQRRALEARLSAALADNRAEQARLQEEYRKLQATNFWMSEAQPQAKMEQQKHLEALEKLAQRRAAEEAEKRKADEARAQQMLQVQKALQEAEVRAMQAEQRKAQEERAAEIKAEHEQELLRLREKHAQAEAEHQRAMQEQEEKTRQLLAAQGPLSLYPGPVASTAGRVSLPADPPVPAPVVSTRPPTDTVLAQLVQLTSMMQQLVQANQAKSEATGTRRSAGKAQRSTKHTEIKSKSRASSATSGAKGQNWATKPGRPGDSDGDGSDSNDSSSSDSSKDELEGQFGAVAQPKRTDTSSRTRVVVRAMIPPDALEKFDEKGPLEDRVNWWERFMYCATMAPWDKKTRVAQLRMRLTGSLKDWWTQLPNAVRSDWKKLSHVFKKEWCRMLSSKAERYNSMEMKDFDTPRTFSYRLNHATKKAGITYLRPTVDREAHIRRFNNALTDSSLRTTHQGQRFDTLDELKKTLKRIEALRQDEGYEKKRCPAQGLQFGRFKPPQRRAEGRAFKAEDVEVGPSLGRQAHFQDDHDLKYEAYSEKDVDRSAERTLCPPVPAPVPVVVSSAQAEPSRSTSLTDAEIFRVAERLVWKPNAQCYDHGGDQHPELVERPVRDEPKSQALCAFAYVGPALPCWRRDNPECTPSYYEAGVYTFDSDLNTLDPEDEMENHLEFALTLGEKYGWWSEHTLTGEKRKMAMVHGAVFHHRTQILLDTGATTSILGLDLARRLKLKLRRGFKLRVTGMGGAPTYITAQAKIKLTLGVRVVYVMDVWVGNIGEGVDCLLGMDFMVAAGVRLCAREGVVRLPDEESLLLIGGPEINPVGLEVSVWLNETAYLYPGQSVIIPVKYHQADPEKVIPWAGRGDQWVTQFIYGPGRKPKAVKVVNISEQEVMICQHTVVACLVEKDYLPNGKRFVRPYSRKYSDWAQLIYEVEPSPDVLRREEEAARLAELNAPPAVERPVYKRPMKLLLLKQSDDPKEDRANMKQRKAEAYAANTVPPEIAQVKVARTPQGRPASWKPPLPLSHHPVEGQSGTSQGRASEGADTQPAAAPNSSESSSTQTPPAGGGVNAQEARNELDRVFRAEPTDFVSDPIARLQETCARCLRVEIREDADEATVYFYEGTALLNDIRDQLAALPELKDLSPKADLSTANVGERGVTTPEVDAQVRTILERHHASFLRDGNAVPAPARGVVCDLDAGDAKPIAQWSQQAPTRLLEGVSMAKTRGISDLLVVSDSRIVIQQAQGLIQCLSPGLPVPLAEFETPRPEFQRLRLVHAKREYNAAADYLTSTTLVTQGPVAIEDPVELVQLKQLNRIPEKLIKVNEPEPADPETERPDTQADVEAVAEQTSLEEAAKPLLPSAKIFVMTRNQARARDAEVPAEQAPVYSPEAATPVASIAERWRHILVLQEAEPWTKKLKDDLNGNLGNLSASEAEDVAKVVEPFTLDSREVLYYLSRATPGRPRDATGSLRLVVPTMLRDDLLQLSHEEFQGGHQGITRTFVRLRRECYWPSMYTDVECHVEECVDCVTTKGAPPNRGPSPGEFLAPKPFEVVSMDFVTHLPKPDRGNVFLLLFRCAFSGFIMCKPMSLTAAYDVAEAYMECVFQRFGASSLLRHDRDPRFMSEVFARFREMLGSRQRTTLACRPQANGQQKRSVQTVVRAMRAYVAEPDQSDWDGRVEKLMWALNTSFDATRHDTPFYLVHGWDSHSTVSAMLWPSLTGLDQRTAYEWCRKTPREYEYVQAWAKDLQAGAMVKRSASQTKIWTKRLKKGFEVGDAVWLYLAGVQSGPMKKSAHLWYGPLRILETSDDFRCELKIEGLGYKLCPRVHVSLLRPRALFPERPTAEIEVAGDDDLDAALLPEDAKEPDEAQNVYEVKAIQDVRWVKRTRTSRRVREDLVKWMGYSDAEWLHLSQRSCGALLYEFSKSAMAKAWFKAMQAGDEPPEPDAQ